MSINSLDYYTIKNIASHLDVQSLYNFSRSSKAIKEICQKINRKKVWEKDFYEIFVDLIIDSIDLTCEGKTSNTMFSIEASLNVIQYVDGIIYNIKRGLAGIQHSNEVIKFILSLSEVLVNLSFQNTLIMCVGTIEPEDETGFICEKFSSADHLFIEEDNWHNERKRIKSCSYHKIPNDAKVKHIEVLLKDKEFLEFCEKIRKILKNTDIKYKTIALSMQILFGIHCNISYEESTNLRCIEKKELSLLINQLLDIRNTNTKHILSRNILPKKLISYVLCFCKFTSHQTFIELVQRYIRFAKSFQWFFLMAFDFDMDSFSDLVVYKEYANVLFKSASCIEKKRGKLSATGDSYHYNLKYLLVGPHSQVEIIYMPKDHFDLCFSIDGIYMEIVLMEVDEYEEEEREEIEKVNQIINNFLIKNLHLNEVKTQPVVTLRFTLSFLSMLKFDKDLFIYNYHDYYHLAVVKLQSRSATRKSKRLAAKKH